MNLNKENLKKIRGLIVFTVILLIALWNYSLILDVLGQGVGIIRIEDFRQGQLVNLRIFFNEKYCTAPGRGIEDILFKDISYTGENAEVSMIIGYDKERKVKNIRFENLQINGEVIYDDMPNKPKWYKTGDMARIFVGEHTEGVTFCK